MQLIWSWAERVSRWAAWAGGAMLIAAALVVTAEVISRKGFGFAFSGSDEIASYLFAVGTAWSLAFVLIGRANVRIDALYMFLGARLRALLDILSLVMLGTFMLMLGDRALTMVAGSLESGARSNTPLRTLLGLPQTLWFAGLVLFLLVLLLVLLRAGAALLKGDLRSVNAVAGVQTQDEEVQGELESLHLGPVEGKR
jgi:TRAP-type C4-dicarboxylate transport system permease small subunit